MSPSAFLSHWVAFDSQFSGTKSKVVATLFCFLKSSLRLRCLEFDSLIASGHIVLFLEDLSVFALQCSYSHDQYESYGSAS